MNLNNISKELRLAALSQDDEDEFDRLWARAEQIECEARGDKGDGLTGGAGDLKQPFDPGLLTPEEIRKWERLEP